MRPYRVGRAPPRSVAVLVVLPMISRPAGATPAGGDRGSWPEPGRDGWAAADTQMFQAFVDRRELDEQEATASGGRRTSVVIAALVALVAVLLLARFVLGR